MSNQEAFLALLKEHNLTQARGAELICKQTMRPCSVRTVRSWLNDPSKPSSRPCPDWALEALKTAIINFCK
ncbi:hypothetical protein EWD61_24525 [Salmonella enterica subsp. enterica serovar Typhimurium]|nr:hypothetical protein [Salmonella enterica subsp. enterica serovar Uganda]ECD1565169.1 hypothetical protein [Salmonella enterica subsp. enterica serovar Typhimurium]EDS2694723.1 hypothetical protein [Salmonella enterica]EDU6247633.1 hypothetical protein [Salmonella enterica subsp. enterica]EED6784267.1 hypothetical protein [Salmonella enterica subsp. enterica serovar Infantis]